MTDVSSMSFKTIIGSLDNVFDVRQGIKELHREVATKIWKGSLLFK